MVRERPSGDRRAQISIITTLTGGVAIILLGANAVVERDYLNGFIILISGVLLITFAMLITWQMLLERGSTE